MIIVTFDILVYVPTFESTRDQLVVLGNCDFVGVLYCLQFHVKVSDRSIKIDAPNTY